MFSVLDTENRPMLSQADGSPLQALGTGDVPVKLAHKDGDIINVTLKNVALIPNAANNLISSKRLMESNHTLFLWNKPGSEIANLNSDIVYSVEYKDGFHYLMDISNDSKPVDVERKQICQTNQITCKHESCLYAWHVKMAHRNMQSVEKLLKECGIPVVNCNGSKEKCEICLKAKGTAPSYTGKGKVDEVKFLETVYSDLVGPLSNSCGGNKYFVMFTESKTKYSYIYMLKSKDETLGKFKNYVAVVKNIFGQMPQSLQTDGEYCNTEFKRFLDSEGIIHKVSASHSPQQNGESERLNRTIQSMVRAMLMQSGLPNSLWAEAANTAVYLHNRIPSKVTGITPFEAWFGKKPGLKHLKIFGSKAYAHIPKETRGKLDARSEIGFVVGYPLGGKGYRVYNPQTHTAQARNVVYVDERNLPCVSNMSDHSNPEIAPDNIIAWLPQLATSNLAGQPSQQASKEANETEGETGTTSQESMGVQSSVRRSERSTKGQPPKKYGFCEMVQLVKEPKNWDEVCSLPDIEKDKWVKAMEQEILSIYEKGVWTLTKLPKDRKAVGSKWVFKIKYKNDGTIDLYKARLVAKGFSQQYGTDYSETFAPVNNSTTFKMLLSVAATRNMVVEHLDVKSAFLNGELLEEIYMEQPEGFRVKGQEDYVLRLNKGLYGLKQSAKAWYDKITELLLRQGFQQGKAEPCLFSRLKNGQFQYVLVYVDDLLVSCHNRDDIKEIVDRLNREIEVKRLGDIELYLGMQVERLKDGTFLLNQKRKIIDFLESVGMQNCKESAIPLEPAYLKEKENKPFKEASEYREAIRKLLYLSKCTRPDISAAVGILCRKVSSPNQHDWNAVKKLARYLKGTMDLKLRISSSENPRLVGYMDASYAEQSNNFRSTSGYLFFYGNGLIDWTTRKQSIVAQSTAEAECVSAASACSQLEWIFSLLKDFGIKEPVPVIMFEDGQACISICKGESTTAKSRSIGIKCELVKDLFQKGLIEIEYCHTEEMVADILTKPLTGRKFEHLREMLNMSDK